MIPFSLALVNLVETSDFADDDRDGLLNGWERNGFGPLDPQKHGCDPLKPDLIICFRIRPGMTEATVQPTIDRMRKFYAAMGKGLNLIPVVLPPHADDDGKVGYIEFYEKGMPQEWRGLAHGVFVSNSPGGGGQANRPDWCGTGYNWFTIVHEVGHQLGLPHDPLGSGLGSPLHGSLMNYDYSYSFDGEAEKVQFSPGDFANLKLREYALDEVLPYPAEKLSFLGKRPHYFLVQSLSPNTTSVDWNRNGIHGERKVRANINDGYSVELRADVKTEKIAGAPVMVANGKNLYMVAPIKKEEKGNDKTNPTAESPAQAALFLIKEKKSTKIATLGEPDVAGDISAVLVADTLHLAHATPTGWKIATYRLSEPTRPSGERGQGVSGEALNQVQATASEQHQDKADPILVATPSGVKTLLRDQVTGAVTLEGKPTGHKSTQPVGAIWNPARKTLALAITEDKDAQIGRIRVVELDDKKSEWLVGGEKSPGLTSNRPILLFDADTKSYKVIVKGYYKDPHQNGLNFMCRQTGSGTGWWIKMLGNEWALSRSVGSAVEFGGDLVYAYRWHGGPEDNSVWISLRSSGIERGVITDFDEVTYILERGLRESLNRVRNEQWPRKGWR